MEEKEIIIPKKGISWKIKVVGVLILILIGFGVYFYFWYTNVNELETEATNVIIQANRYDALVIKIKNENDRCQNFISQKQGDFGDFEYCKRYIQWYQNNAENLSN